MWLWLISDSREHGISWPMDMGMFLYVAWIFVIPYHLFRTRGFSGVVPILMVVFAFMSAWLLGSVAGVFLWF
jgi:hypothetical protein